MGGHGSSSAGAKLFEFAADFGAQLGFAGQMEFVAAGEDVFAARPEGVADDGVVFVGAKDEAEGGVVAGRAAVFVVVVHIQLKLAEVFVRQFADIEVNEHVAFENGVVEDEINVEMVAVESEALLAGDEGEAFAQFQEEGLKVGDEGGFEFRLNEPGRFGQAEEFDDDGGL